MIVSFVVVDGRTEEAVEGAWTVNIWKQIKPLGEAV